MWQKQQQGFLPLLKCHCSESTPTESHVSFRSLTRGMNPEPEPWEAVGTFWSIFFFFFCFEAKVSAGCFCLIVGISNMKQTDLFSECGGRSRPTSFWQQSELINRSFTSVELFYLFIFKFGLKGNQDETKAAAAAISWVWAVVPSGAWTGPLHRACRPIWSWIQTRSFATVLDSVPGSRPTCNGPAITQTGLWYRNGTAYFNLLFSPSPPPEPTYSLNKVPTSRLRGLTRRTAAASVSRATFGCNGSPRRHETI